MQLTPTVKLPEEVGLDMPAADIRVVTMAGDGSIAVVLTIGVIAPDMHIVARDGQSHAPADAPLEPHRRIDEAETAALERCRHIDILAVKLRARGGDGEDTGRGKLPCGAEDVVILPVRQGDGGHTVEREAAEVYLSRLCVGDRHSVISDPGVRCPEAAHRDGLETADAAIVLDSHAIHHLDRIRQLQSPQTPQACPVEHLHGHGRAQASRHAAGGHAHLIDIDHTH